MLDGENTAVIGAWSTGKQNGFDSNTPAGDPVTLGPAGDRTRIWGSPCLRIKKSFSQMRHGQTTVFSKVAVTAWRKRGPRKRYCCGTRTWWFGICFSAYCPLQNWSAVENISFFFHVSILGDGNKMVLLNTPAYNILNAKMFYPPDLTG